MPWSSRSLRPPAILLALLVTAAAPHSPMLPAVRALAGTSSMTLASPPSDGIMGFVVYHFVPALIADKTACPNGLAPRNREIFLGSLSPAERERLAKKENEAEFNRRWRATLTDARGNNICSQYSEFPDRPLMPMVQSSYAPGIDLDNVAHGGAQASDGCPHQGFTSPDGRTGIDNQAYRALGCTSIWRGDDGTNKEMARGYNQFIASGEYTQVLLLRGVDSLANDDDVEVIYGNTPDRPIADASGAFLRNASYTISDKAPRHRNVLRGRIKDGVLTTESSLIVLTQTWGQSADRDLRGIRSRWTLHKGRLRLAFQTDGTLKGVVAGYQPLDELNKAAILGGLGSAMVAGIDCAGEYNTLRKLADGMRDPHTGECRAISSAMELEAVPAYVNDVAARSTVASR